MTRAKFDIEKFDGTGDFGLWRVKMRALLIQHGCGAALEGLSADMEAKAKAELNKKAHSAVILCLGNKVMREVTRETTATGVWSKLETLYMTKSLANKLYLKKKLYTFYMPAGRKIFEHIDEFNKIVLDLANIEVKFEDEDLALLLLTSLPASYEHFVDTLLYGRESFTLEDDHLKRNCPKNNHKKSTSYVKKDKQPSSSGSTYDDSKVTMVMSAQLGDNRECKIRGIGKVRAQLKDGLSFVLHDVRYIPELKRNLISLGTLEKEGYTVKLQSSKVKVSLMLVLKKKKSCAGLAQKTGTYQRGGTTGATTQGVIDYVHSDLWGLSQVESLRGKRYFLSIVDDYSRRVWVYILRFKHKAFGKFKEWKQLVENQTERTVKKLRTDNGLEFCNQEFEQLCIKSGIARHLTVAETPQQNRVAERRNRTLMDKEDGDDEDAGDQATDQPSDLTDYQLVWDREPRTRTKPLRFRDESNITTCTFVVAEEEDTHEPLTYQDPVACEDSSKWKAAMKEEMDSLRKNKTWELVDHHAGQNLVSCKWLFKIKEGIKGVQKPSSPDFAQHDDLLIP
nr:retrovirus-related Pol polyprotein from transposon TNT 1-94 [Tanacetum cinerariifolium]